MNTKLAILTLGVGVVVSHRIAIDKKEVMKFTNHVLCRAIFLASQDLQ